MFQACGKSPDTQECLGIVQRRFRKIFQIVQQSRYNGTSYLGSELN
jgi:hypothetical protein